MRRSGYYWCLRGYIWDVNYWSGGDFGEWWVAGVEQSMCDDDFDEIDERRIVREVE